MLRPRPAWIIVVALGVGRCASGTDLVTDDAGVSSTADAFEREPVALERSSVFVVNPRRLSIEVPSCNGRPVVADLHETASEIRIQVITNTDSSAECLDGVTVSLEEPLGDRAVIDDVSGNALPVSER